MAYVVTFVELVGGVLLIVGLLSRLSALLLTINLTVAVLLVKTGVGLSRPWAARASAQSWTSPLSPVSSRCCLRARGGFPWTTPSA